MNDKVKIFLGWTDEEQAACIEVHGILTRKSSSTDLPQPTPLSPKLQSPPEVSWVPPPEQQVGVQPGHPMWVGPNLPQSYVGNYQPQPMQGYYPAQPEWAGWRAPGSIPALHAMPPAEPRATKEEPSAEVAKARKATTKKSKVKRKYRGPKKLWTAEDRAELYRYFDEGNRNFVELGKYFGRSSGAISAEYYEGYPPKRAELEAKRAQKEAEAKKQQPQQLGLSFDTPSQMVDPKDL